MVRTSALGRGAPRGARLRRRAWRGWLVALLALAAPASAQTLAEVTLVAAIQSQLYPALSLPSGTFRAEGPGAVALIARIPDAAAWTDWEVYTATGIVMALENAFVYGAQRDLILEGFDSFSQEELVVDGVRHLRMVFEGGGGRALVYVIRDPTALVWLLARGR